MFKGKQIIIVRTGPQVLNTVQNLQNNVEIEATLPTHRFASNDTSIKETPTSYISMGNPVLKDTFTWSKEAAMTMLDCYQMRFGTAGYARADRKLWQCIADDLNSYDKKLFPDPVTWNQVKDKFNNTKGQALKKKDHNSRGGNVPREFSDTERRVLEIIGSMREGGDDDVAVGTPIMFTPIVNTTNMEIEDDLDSLSQPPSPETSQNQDTSRHKTVVSRNPFRSRKKHGTGSNQAKTKLQLELQWSQHLERLATLDEQKSEATRKNLEIARRSVAAKERRNDLLRQYIQLKEKSIRNREERFRRLLDLEQQKIDLQRRLLEQQTVDLKRRKLDMKEARLCDDLLGGH